jgi:hypothetical protein
MNLPRWAHKPTERVRSWFDYRHAIRDEAKVKEVPVVALEGETLTEVRDHLRKDFVAFLHSCAMFAARNTRKLMRAELMPGQLVIAWRVQAMIDAGVPIRIVFLKVRQMGSSWLWMQFAYWYLGFRPNRGELILSHEKDTTKQIFGYLREAWFRMPPELRPAYEHSSTTLLNLNAQLKKRLAGAEGLNSQAAVLTAKNNLGGTGFPTQGVIGSEAGRYDLVTTSVASLMTSIGGGIQEDDPDTFKVWESTAFGAGTWFHRECKAAQLGHGDKGWNGYLFIFVPWFFDPRNAAKKTSLSVEDLESDEKSLFGNERALMTRFDLTLEQMDWRRQRIMAMPDDAFSKLDLFKQDFPSTPEEAWLHSVGRAFAPDFVTSLRERVDAEALKPMFIGEMAHERSKGTALDFRTWTMMRPGGPLRIYRLPNPSYDYLVGADLAFGLTGGDRSCFKVYQRVGFPSEERRPMRLAAEWIGHADDDTFAHLLWRIGWFYSVGYGPARVPAMLAWESSGPGQNVARWLRKGENPEQQIDPYPAGRMFRKYHQHKLKGRHDVAFGIATTATSKPVMIGEFVKAARADELQLIAEDVDEIETLERDEKNKIDTQGKDRFMAVVMAAFAAVTTPIMWGREEDKPEQPKPYTGAWFEMKRQQRLADEAGEDTYENILEDLT